MATVCVTQMTCVTDTKYVCGRHDDCLMCLCNRWERMMGCVCVCV